MSPLRLRSPELFGVTESSATLYFRVERGGEPDTGEVEVWIDGRIRATSQGELGTRCVRLEGLDPDREYQLELRTRDSAHEADGHCPSRFRTLPAPSAPLSASFATLNDLHFGEPHFGFFPGREDEGVRASEGEVPYPRFMNEDAIADINAQGVDFSVIKGDISHRGSPEEFAEARLTFTGFESPHHVMLGNHDYYAHRRDEEVDGYALLESDPLPREVDAGRWQVLLVETSKPGESHGSFESERVDWLRERLEAAQRHGRLCLLVMHHQPVAPEQADGFPGRIGIPPVDSMPLFRELSRHPHLRGVLIGHTHRNRLLRYPETGDLPFVEVHNPKDYPGGWAHYRLFEDGSFHQEARRTASRRALDHSTRCGDLFEGRYREFAIGDLATRSFAIGPLR